MGHPFPKVTDVICLVPQPRFARSPSYSQLVYLCRFAVRILHNLSRGFSWKLIQPKSLALRLTFPKLDLKRLYGFAYTNYLAFGTQILNRPRLTGSVTPLIITFM